MGPWGRPQSVFFLFQVLHKNQGRKRIEGREEKEEKRDA